MSETTRLSMSSWLSIQQWANLSFPTALMMLTIILVFFVTGVLFLYSPIDSLLQTLDRRRKDRPPLPPGSFGLPIIGELRPFLKNRISFRNERHAKYGPVFKTNVLGKMVFMEPPAGNKFLFSNEGKLVETSFPGPAVKLLGTHSLVVQTGNTHKLARRHMAPFFTPQALEKNLPRIEEHIRNHFKDVWRPAAGDHDDQEWEMPVVKSLELVTYSIVADLLIGQHPQEIEELRKLQTVLMDGFGRLPINIPGTHYYRGLRAREKMAQNLGTLLSRRRVELNKGSATSSQDFMSYALTVPDDNGRLFNNEEIKDKILFNLLAGHLTSSTTLALVLRFIALLPDVRQGIQDEHQAIARQKREGAGLTREDLAKMKYTWRVIQETMRMHSVAQGSYRQTLEDIEYGGFLIPKGWKIMWTVQSHTDPRSFKNPDIFDPDRFDGSQQIVPYSYVPFGGGPHTCIGNEYAKMEMLLIVYYLMRDYMFTLVYPDEPFYYFPYSSQKSGTRLRVKKLNLANSLVK